LALEHETFLEALIARWPEVATMLAM